MKQVFNDSSSHMRLVLMGNVNIVLLLTNGMIRTIPVTAMQK